MKADAFSPYSWGMPGIALCNSAVVAQYALPPTLSMVAPGVRSRGPKPLSAKPRTMARAAEEVVHHGNLLAAPSGDISALRADHGDEIAAERMIIAHVLRGSQELHVAAEAGEVLAELRVDAVGRVSCCRAYCR